MTGLGVNVVELGDIGENLTDVQATVIAIDRNDSKARIWRQGETLNRTDVDVFITAGFGRNLNMSFQNALYLTLASCIIRSWNVRDKP